MNGSGRLIVVSNRLPVTIERQGGDLLAKPSSGGLVSALLPAFQENGGCWVGWPGTAYDPGIAHVLRTECAPEYSFEPVFLSENETECFYHGCSNEIIWPLFHDLQTRCNFDPAYWTVHLEAIRKFASTVLRTARKDDFIWVHDYHLMMLGEALRERGVRNTLAYFHHIPFPPPDIFEKLPWRSEILRGLLQFSLIGFQTVRDRRNFLACVRRCLAGARIRRAGARTVVRAEGRCAAAGTFPIGIDFRSYAEDAARPEVEARAAEIRGSLEGMKIVLGLDRLDYTKGVPQRLAGFRALLAGRPELRGRVVLLQLVVPSRETIPQYRDLREVIERMVSEINGEFSRPGWTPIAYLHRSVPRTELLALYRAADVALITPLKDGMNLVAKEFCAARVDELGVLVLSEFAGSAEQLGENALLVNPYDSEGMAALLERALRMDADEQRARMQRMREVVRAKDVFHWCRSICGEHVFRSPQVYATASALPQLHLVSRAV